MSHSAHIIHHHQHLRLKKTRADEFIFFIAIFSPISTVPQIVKVYVEKNVSGVSAATWFLSMVFAAIWIWYGYLHRDRAILLNNVLWLIVTSMVFVGALIYR